MWNRYIAISIALNILLIVVIICFIMIGWKYSPSNNNTQKSLSDSPMICDCMDNFKPLWSKKSYTEYYLISEIVHYHETTSMTMDRLESINNSIGENMDMISKSSIYGKVFTDLLNKWDNHFIKYCNDTLHKGKLNAIPIEWLEIEEKITTLIPSLSKSMLADYRINSLSYMSHLMYGHYASSWVDLDNGSRIGQLMSETIYGHLLV